MPTLTAGDHAGVFREQLYYEVATADFRTVGGGSQAQVVLPFTSGAVGAASGALLQLAGAAALYINNATTTGPVLEFRHGRGTYASPTVLTTGDDIGRINFYGAVAAGEYVLGASIEADMAGTIATTRGPSTLTFKTATDAAPSVLTTAMVISAAQIVTFSVGAVSTGNLTLSYTLTAGADGVGADGEQLTSGGAAAETDWAAAGSLREFKHDLGEKVDARAALKTLLATPIHSFRYKSRDEYEGDLDHPITTGDHETEYVGVMADEAPWAMHHSARILNPINALGYTVLSIQALEAENEQLRARLDRAGIAA